MAYGKIKADTFVYDNSGSDVEVTLSSLGNKANLASPTFTGTVTIPTPAANDNTTKAASTAYVQTELGDYLTTALGAPKASPTFTGTVNAAALTLSGNLTVNGTTTTIDSTTLNVEDKNIELGKVSSPSDTTADGGGITLKGATDKTITWVDATDAWTFNQNIEVTSGEIKIVGGEAQPANLHLYADEGDDNADKWRIRTETSGNLNIQNYAAGSWGTAITGIGNGAIEIRHANTKVFETTTAGVTVTGTVTDTKGELRKIPRNDQTSNYTAVSADAGKAITANMGSGTVTINANVFAEGDALTLLNYSSSDLTIAQGSGFGLTNSADAATGNRTLAAKGMATIYFLGGTAGYISGAGLS